MSGIAKNPFEPFFEEIRRIVKEEIKAANANKAPEELLTPDELAGKLKLPVSWVYEQSRQGKIPTRRVGRYIRFSLAEILESEAAKKKLA